MNAGPASRCGRRVLDGAALRGSGTRRARLSALALLLGPAACGSPEPAPPRPEAPSDPATPTLAAPDRDEGAAIPTERRLALTLDPSTGVVEAADTDRVLDLRTGAWTRSEGCSVQVRSALAVSLATVARPVRRSRHSSRTRRRTPAVESSR